MKTERFIAPKAADHAGSAPLAVGLPAAFLALLAGWTLPLAAVAVWGAFIVATFAVPCFLPFFSWIVLDVTPQIDQTGTIMLHVHPSVSEVTESQRVVNLGGPVPSITLPLARSTISETDTIVRYRTATSLRLAA